MQIFGPFSVILIQFYAFVLPLLVPDVLIIMLVANDNYYILIYLRLLRSVILSDQ